MSDISELRKQLEIRGQSHLLTFYDDLNDDQRRLLVGQLEKLDWNQIDELIKNYVLQKPLIEPPANMLPPKIVPADGGDRREEGLARGEQLLREGKVAAFTVAGGQGTRLGYEGPKGCLPATPVVKKPLFRLFAEQIRAASLRYGVTIPWYIMASTANDTATQAHFRQNDFWGFDPKDVIFFQQGTMPAMDFSGKLLLQEKFLLTANPDGHGGCLTAMQVSGALADMAARGIEQISYFQIDNPLVHAIDPLFIGLHDLLGAEMSAKALPKREPMEKLGNFCTVDGRVMVIEYSDMPEDLAMACNADGTLKFSAGSIAIHMFRRDFVEHLTAGGRYKLPWHRADKKVPHVDLSTGQMIRPESPNAVKLEMFVFDAMPLAEKTLILETRRDEEFSPIKNKEGQDSLPTCLYDQVRRWAGWLEHAGVTVPRDASGQVAAAIEISPLYADSAGVLKTKVDKTLTISPGQNFYLGSRGQIGGS